MEADGAAPEGATVEVEKKGITLNNEHLLVSLETMGVTEYDPLVLSALAEYARRKSCLNFQRYR